MDFEIEDEDDPYDFQSNWSKPSKEKSGGFGFGFSDGKSDSNGDDDAYNYDFGAIKNETSHYSGKTEKIRDSSSQKGTEKPVEKSKPKPVTGGSAMDKAAAMLAKHSGKPSARPAPVKQSSLDFDEDDISISMGSDDSYGDSFGNRNTTGNKKSTSKIKEQSSGAGIDSPLYGGLDSDIPHMKRQSQFGGGSLEDSGGLHLEEDDVDLTVQDSIMDASADSTDDFNNKIDMGLDAGPSLYARGGGGEESSGSYSKDDFDDADDREEVLETYGESVHSFNEEEEEEEGGVSESIEFEDDDVGRKGKVMEFNFADLGISTAVRESDGSASPDSNIYGASFEEEGLGDVGEAVTDKHEDCGSQALGMSRSTTTVKLLPPSLQSDMMIGDRDMDRDVGVGMERGNNRDNDRDQEGVKVKGDMRGTERDELRNIVQKSTTLYEQQQASLQPQQQQPQPPQQLPSQPPPPLPQQLPPQPPPQPPQQLPPQQQQPQPPQQLPPQQQQPQPPQQLPPQQQQPPPPQQLPPQPQQPLQQQQQALDPWMYHQQALQQPLYLNQQMQPQPQYQHLPPQAPQAFAQPQFPPLPYAAYPTYPPYTNMYPPYYPQLAPGAGVFNPYNMPPSPPFAPGPGVNAAVGGGDVTAEVSGREKVDSALIEMAKELRLAKEEASYATQRLADVILDLHHSPPTTHHPHPHHRHKTTTSSAETPHSHSHSPKKHSALRALKSSPISKHQHPHHHAGARNGSSEEDEEESYLEDDDFDEESDLNMSISHPATKVKKDSSTGHTHKHAHTHGSHGSSDEDQEAQREDKEAGPLCHPPRSSVRDSTEFDWGDRRTTSSAQQRYPHSSLVDSISAAGGGRESFDGVLRASQSLFQRQLASLRDRLDTMNHSAALSSAASVTLPVHSAQLRTSSVTPLRSASSSLSEVKGEFASVRQSQQNKLMTALLTVDPSLSRSDIASLMAKYS